MAYATAAILSLATQCAPTVAPQTVVAIVRTESGGQPFALNVNGGKQPARQSNAAAATARRYICGALPIECVACAISWRSSALRPPLPCAKALSAASVSASIRAVSLVIFTWGLVVMNPPIAEGQWSVNTSYKTRRMAYPAIRQNRQTP